jgi:CoA:oxalate CoA-transferase
LPIIDFSTGIYGALGIMYALRHRDRTGEGQLVDVALFDVAISFIGITAMEMKKAGQQRTQVGNATYWALANTFKAKDGWVFISLTTNPIWKRFCKLIQEEQLLTDERYIDDYNRFVHRENLISIIDQWTSSRTIAEIVAITGENHIPCSPVNDVRTAMADPQVLAREMLVNIDYGKDLGTIPVPGLPVKLSKTRCRLDRPAPGPGQDNREIYRKILGYDSDMLDTLRKEEII